MAAVADKCIEVSKARAQLLDNKGKGSKKKQEDREVNAAGHEDQDQSDQKFKHPFRRLTDAKKWCEIHCTI
jgi:hypothetical protein